MTQRTLPTRGKSGRCVAARELENDKRPTSPTQFPSTARDVSLPHLASTTHAVPLNRFAPPIRDASPALSASDRAHASSPSDSDRPHSPHISQRDFNTAVRNILAWRPSGNVDPTPFGAAELRFYPDIAARMRCTRQALTEFLELSAESLIRDENDVMKYYQGFLTIALPLLKDNKITDDDFNAEFFKGFHADDQDILADQVFRINPQHPANEPFEVEDVVSAARQYFANDQFHKPLQLRVRSELRGRPKSRGRDPEQFIHRLFGDDHPSKRSVRDNKSPGSEPEQDDAPAALERPTYETRNVRFKESGSAKAQPGAEDDPVALVSKLKSLSVHEPSYLVLYSHCQERFPNIVQHLPKPDLFATQEPPVLARQPWAQRSPAPPDSSSVAAASEIDAFFYDRNGAQSRSCVFCGMLGHRIRGCPTAEEYVDTGRVKIVGNRLHLPTGQAIPNDGRGLGLKASIDAWPAANS